MMTQTDPRHQLAAGIAVPLLLALLSGVQMAVHRPATEYILLPPFAVVIYLIFRTPAGESTGFRSVVVLPCLAAVIGELCGHYLGLSPPGVAVATIVVLCLQFALRAQMPPALAIAVLAMLLHAWGLTYLLGVFQGTLIIFITFSIWCRFGAQTST
ncbi:MAG TPA: HPP family protein [Candidatus Cybelea sp.]|jgi:CBS-domain-containing membrane protein